MMSCPLARAAGGDSIACRQMSVARSLVGAGAGLVINAAATEILKNSVREWRPDLSDNNSFPSRHSSYAFALASVASRELSRFSPLWTIAVHSLADAVAMQRVYASRHYPSDVLAGAALGVVSVQLGYSLSRLLWPGRSAECRTELMASGNVSFLSASTVALIPFSSHSGAGMSVGCGIESSLSFGLPMASAWGLGASLRLRSQPVYSDGIYSGALNGAGATVDSYFGHWSGLWAVDGTASVGLIGNFDRPRADAAKWSGLAAISAGVSRRVARGLSVGGRIGCDIVDRPAACVNLSVALVTRAEF